LTENARIDAKAAAAAEAQRVEAARLADLAERERRERVQFELNGPGDVAIVEMLASHFSVSNGDVVGWLKRFDAESFDDKIQQQKAA
jgi:thiamine biosynthesis protein ThiC